MYKEEELAELVQASRLIKGYEEYALELLNGFQTGWFCIFKIMANLKEYRQLMSDSSKAMDRWNWIINKMDRIAKSYKGES